MASRSVRAGPERVGVGPQPRADLLNLLERLALGALASRLGPASGTRTSQPGPWHRTPPRRRLPAGTWLVVTSRDLSMPVTGTVPEIHSLWMQSDRYDLSAATT